MEKIKKVRELTPHETVIIELVNRYGKTWEKIATELKAKADIVAKGYQIKRFYDRLPPEVLKKYIPEMIPLYADMLDKMLDALKRLEAVTPEAKAAPGYYMAFTTLVKNIVELRKEIASASGETPWNERVMNMLKESTEFFTEILLKHLPKEKVLEIILDWNEVVPAIDVRNRI
ncbi:MAG: hypothetical protein PHX21_05900 [bacterium]|nr:hypothetical protein [bacterium]